MSTTILAADPQRVFAALQQVLAERGAEIEPGASPQHLAFRAYSHGKAKGNFLVAKLSGKASLAAIAADQTQVTLSCGIKVKDAWIQIVAVVIGAFAVLSGLAQMGFGVDNRGLPPPPPSLSSTPSGGQGGTFDSMPRGGATFDSSPQGGGFGNGQRLPAPPPQQQRQGATAEDAAGDPVGLVVLGLAAAGLFGLFGYTPRRYREQLLTDLRQRLVQPIGVSTAALATAYPAAPATPPTVADPQASDPVAQIRVLAKMRDEGLITPEEYEAKRADIVARL